ncbi:transcription termination factor 3, mitochondrial [Ascaphus truei]|uniref:transcription termination factor 3, mitochondrial n=1 Tax=Ascaphus truei TaxID=8439 RepID=UPI003F5A34EC
MALIVCWISRRCWLLSIRNHGHFSNGLTTSATRRLLRKNDPVPVQFFLSRFRLVESTACSRVSLPGRTYTQRSSEAGTKVIFPENNLPSISLNQQEIAVTPSTDIETLPEVQDCEGEPPLLPLEEITEDEAVQITAGPSIPPDSFTLRDYVDHSETLRKLVLLGVDLSKIEKRPNVATFLLKLDFEKDVSKILLFLKDVGLEDGQLGAFLTKNPFILSEDLDNLQKRVAYLSLQNFSKEDIARMVSRAPYLLNFSVERLDNRLGFFQKELGLSVEKTKDLVIRLPRMLTRSLEPIKEILKVCQIELGFRENEIQHIVTKVPKMLTASKKKLTETFNYVHNEIGIPHHLIVKFPQIFNTKLLRLKERHAFLTFLGRAAYDPTQPNYVSLDKLSSLPDEAFCAEVAKASVQEFEQFLKTL